MGFNFQVDSSWNVKAHGDAREGKWRGNPSHCLGTCVSNITTADAHTLVASSRLNWRPRRFKWTRPLRWKKKSGFCACAITFKLSSTALDDGDLNLKYSQWVNEIQWTASGNIWRITGPYVAQISTFKNYETSRKTVDNLRKCAHTSCKKHCSNRSNYTERVWRETQSNVSWLWISSLDRAFRKITSNINQQMHLYNFHLKHIKLLQHVSIFSDHHQGVSSSLAKVITYSQFSSFL